MILVKPVRWLVPGFDMERGLSSNFLLIIAFLFAVMAVAIWGVFLRPASLHTAFGMITRKTFKPAGTYWRYPVGLDRGFRMATPVSIAESYVFEITTDGSEGPAYFSLNPVAGEAFAVGQRVKIRYRERVIPFIWKRAYVVDMERR